MGSRSHAVLGRGDVQRLRLLSVHAGCDERNRPAVQRKHRPEHPKTATALGGYEASDLLFATTKDVKASDSPVRLTFKHIMSKLKIRLIKGEDFEGDMPTTAKVYIHNTVPTATIDLQAGVATRYVKGTRQTIVAHQDGDTSYSAIIVPQRIDNRQPLVEVEMMGVSYLFEQVPFQARYGASCQPRHIRKSRQGEDKHWRREAELVIKRLV